MEFIKEHPTAHPYPCPMRGGSVNTNPPLSNGSQPGGITRMRLMVASPPIGCGSGS